MRDIDPEDLCHLSRADKDMIGREFGVNAVRTTFVASMAIGWYFHSLEVLSPLSRFCCGESTITVLGWDGVLRILNVVSVNVILIIP